MKFEGQRQIDGTGKKQKSILSEVTQGQNDKDGMYSLISWIEDIKQSEG